MIPDDGSLEWTKCPILAVVESESNGQKLSVRASGVRFYCLRSLVRMASVVRVCSYAIRG